MSKNENDVVIVSAVRTPFGKYGGVLKDINSVDLATIPMKEVLQRVNFPAEKLDEIYYGTCEPIEYGMDINVPARQALLKAGFSVETLSMTIDTACCSSMDAVILGAGDIKLGISKTVMAVGTDNMCRQPYYVYPSFRWTGVRGDIVLKDPIRRGANYPVPMVGPIAADVGEVALEYGVSREVQDGWGYTSQMRYKKAYAEGKFKDEMIIPLEIPQENGAPISIDIDEQHRSDTTLEKMAKLPTVYGSPTVTAGNAPGINTGAAAILFMSREKAIENGLKPLAKIVAQSRAAGVPRLMATKPATAIQLALNEANLSLDDMDLIEINEAFAAVVLVSAKILADGDDKKYQTLLERTNVNGGAVAIGHPVGASGARLIMTLMYELRRRGGKYAVAALCGGLCQASATIIEIE
ncbi:thiolase family protein [Chloroflexota bacterium]